MDLATLVSDKRLLASLTREYELLKATNAAINYEEWITRRLQLAAAAKGTSTLQPSTAAAPSPSHAAPAGQNPAVTQAAPAGDSTFRGDVAQGDASLFEGSTGLQGGQELQAGNKWGQPSDAQQQDHQQPPVEEASTSQPPAEPLLQQSGRIAPLWQPQGTYDYAAAEGGQRGAATQPQWVAAAKLQSSLQSSSVVPLMHAAAERDRTLAATAALVRQQLALGSSGVSSVAQLQQLYLQQRGSQQQEMVANTSKDTIHGDGGVVKAVLDEQQHEQQQHQNVVPDSVPVDAVASPPVSTSQQQQHQQQQALPDVVKNSWLLRTVLQPHNSQAGAGSSTSGKPAGPDFIRITGESGRSKPSKPQQQPATNSSDKRSQLKAALKQLLSSSSSGSSGQLQQPQGVSGILQQLLNVQQQQQQGAFHGQQHQLQQVATQLQEVLYDLSSRTSRERHLRQRQDENSSPMDVMQQQHSPPHSSARQQLLQRQEQRQQQRLQKAAAVALGSKSPRRPQQRGTSQQQQQRQQPAWQSDVYVPPPVQLLKRKNAGYVDAWGVPAAGRLPTGRPVSAERVRQIRPSSASKAGRSTRPQSIHSKQQHKQRQQRYKQPLGDSSNQHTSVSHSAAIHRPLSPVQECSHEPLFADDLLASAARLSSRSSGDWQQGMPSSAVMAPTAATVAGNEERGFGSLSAEQVQDIEQQVQQQLQQEKQQEEAIRLSRLEDTAGHILGVLARLEQQLQQPAPALPAAPASSAATPETAAEAAADTSPLQDPMAMSELLSALERMEAQEQEIRDRWFGWSEVPAAPGMRRSAEIMTTSAVLDVKDGALVSYSSQPAAAAVTAEGANNTTAAAASSEQTASTGVDSSQQQQGQQKQQQQEVLSKDTLKSIKHGRRRFLKHQAMVDGQLELLDNGSPSPLAGFGNSSGRKGAKQQLQPTLVVEAVADLLLDELLLEQVEELDGYMDALCNQLFDEEFVEA